VNALKIIDTAEADAGVNAVKIQKSMNRNG